MKNESSQEPGICLVTGGSRGIGAAIVRELSRDGFQVVINYNKSADCAQELADECCAKGGRVMTVQADVSDTVQVEAMFATVEAQWGQIDVLVNNAGIDLLGLLTDTSDKQWDRVVDINLKGPFLCCRRAIPYMVHQRYGRIINIASVWGLNGASCESVYAASKGGLIALTRSLAVELGPSGITVNAVAPGPIATEMLNTELDADEKRSLEEGIPLGRCGLPQEVAAACSYLLSDQAAFINGHVLVLDGGWKV